MGKSYSLAIWWARTAHVQRSMLKASTKHVKITLGRDESYHRFCIWCRSHMLWHEGETSRCGSSKKHTTCHRYALHPHVPLGHGAPVQCWSQRHVSCWSSLATGALRLKQSRDRRVTARQGRKIQFPLPPLNIIRAKRVLAPESCVLLKASLKKRFRSTFKGPEFFVAQDKKIAFRLRRPAKKRFRSQ